MQHASRRSAIRRLLLLGSTALLAACAPSTPPAPPARTAPAPSATPGSTGPAAPAATGTPTPARVAASPAAAASPTTLAPFHGAWVAKTASQMIWAAAADAGYAAQHGVDLQFVYVNGSSTAIPGLISGELQGVCMSGAATVNGVAGGADLVMVAGFVNQAVYRVMGLPEITRIEQLKGQQIAVTRIGQTDYFAWQTILPRFGLQMSDVTFVNAGAVDGQIAMLQQRQAQAAAVTPPSDVLALRAGAHEVLDTTPFRDPDVVHGIVVTRAYLAQHRPVVLDVIRASIEAVHRWETDPDFIKGLIGRYLDTTDQAVIDAGEAAYRAVLPRVPAPSAEALQRDIDQAATSNPRAAGLTPAQLMDGSLVQEIADSGSIDRLFGPA